jgi:hypothetical protein
MRRLEQRNRSMSDLQLLDDHEAAAIVRRSARTLARWRNAGEGPAYISVKGRPLYRERDLAAWIEAQLVKPARSRGA